LTHQKLRLDGKKNRLMFSDGRGMIILEAFYLLYSRLEEKSFWSSHVAGGGPHSWLGWSQNQGFLIKTKSKRREKPGNGRAHPPRRVPVEKGAPRETNGKKRPKTGGQKRVNPINAR